MSAQPQKNVPVAWLSAGRPPVVSRRRLFTGAVVSTFVSRRALEEEIIVDGVPRKCVVFIAPALHGYVMVYGHPEGKRPVIGRDVTGKLLVLEETISTGKSYPAVHIIETDGAKVTHGWKAIQGALPERYLGDVHRVIPLPEPIIGSLVITDWRSSNPRVAVPEKPKEPVKPRRRVMLNTKPTPRETLMSRGVREAFETGKHRRLQVFAPEYAPKHRGGPRPASFVDFAPRFLYIVRTPSPSFGRWKIANFQNWSWVFKHMARSLKKGPYVDEKLMKKVTSRKSGAGAIKTWARRSQIAPEFVGYTFAVHTGKNFDEVYVSEDMVGHRLGEFAPTTKFIRHGGKMQKETELAAKAAEIATAQAAKATAAAPAKK